jgi:CRP/FNR family transcriptional regulator
MEQVTCGAIDPRLAAALRACRSAAGNDLLHITHQTLAMELGTAREVISRHLKRFEARGWLRLGRGTIELVDMTRLGRLSQLTG